MTPPVPPTPAPRVVRCYPRIWIVVGSDGQRFLVEREPLGGMAAWAAGQKVTVIEYTTPAVIYPAGATALPVPHGA